MPAGLVVLAIATAVGAAIVGGAFYAFSSFVMRALGELPSAEGIRAMQRINVTVITPTFMLPLMGTVLTSLALGIWSVVDWDADYSPYLVAAAAAYVVGCVNVTMVLNVPRNDRMAALDASSPEAEEPWRRYIREWTLWNTVRTVASLAAVVLIAIGIAAS